MTVLRCAHLSDLHFSHPTWSPSQFFSKRWIGNLNLLFARKRIYTSQHFDSLVLSLKEQKITHVFITGDLSCTSLKAEFQQAQQFKDFLTQQGMRVFIVPGNHDQYTKKAYRTQLFYEYFTSTFSDDTALLPPAMNLKQDKVTALFLGQHWWLVGIDTAIATSLLSSSGYFSPQLEKNLEATLTAIPSTDSILLMNHFPIFASGSWRSRLMRKEALCSLLQRFSNIRFYLHGHTHRHCVADLRANQLPIILDSGSAAHKTIGSWNMLEMGTDRCRVEVYRWQHTPERSPSGIWLPSAEHIFRW